MENFILWGMATDSLPERLSFLATRIQWPCIHRGTRTMIDRMLTDLGLSNVEYRDWTIVCFRSNYYMSHGESLLDPEVWTETWEISLATTRPVPDMFRPMLQQLNDRLDIVRSFARDDTWDGTAPPADAPYVIVARFYNERLFMRMLDAMGELRDPNQSGDPELADLIDVLKHHPSSSQVSVIRRASDAMEIIIQLGVFDKAQFLSNGLELAQKLTELIHELGGTTTWDEHSAYTVRSSRT